MSWGEIFAEMDLVEVCFAAVLHYDLEALWPVRTWRWFAAGIGYLLDTDTPLARHFTPTPGRTPDV